MILSFIPQRFIIPILPGSLILGSYLLYQTLHDQYVLDPRFQYIDEYWVGIETESSIVLGTDANQNNEEEGWMGEWRKGGGGFRDN